MRAIVDISVDPTTLQATISLSEDNQRIINELKLIFSGLSETFHFNAGERMFSIPWFEFRRGLIGIAQVLKRENADVRFGTFAKTLLQEIVSDRKAIKEKSSSLDVTESELEEILKEAGFGRELKTEQKRDVLKLVRLKHGANFSVPGAGKTTVILALHAVLSKFNLVSKLFVICPINAFISWEDEIVEIFKTKKLTVARLQRQDLQDFSQLETQNPSVILVNYEKLRKDVRQLVPFFIGNKVHFVLDESHRVKSGINNISYNQIIKLADLAKRRDILSGTPMPQNYLDLEPQFDFLWPGEKVVTKDIVPRDEDKIIKVNEAINGLFVRTTKNELGLTDPIIEYTTLQMGPVQAELYRLFKSEAARVISGMDKPNIYNFRRIGRSVVKLLQAATNPMLLTLKDEYDEEIIPIPTNREFWELLEEFTKFEKPTKIEHLRKRVKEVLEEKINNKVLIWSYFVRNIQILEKLLKEYNPVTVYGGIPTGSDEDEAYREGRIRKFHEDPTCRVMIANPQACGEGISLHRVCHHAIYLDRNFNAAYFLQSIDRIHRLGLSNEIETKIEILIAENSIDEILINRLNEKIKTMGDVLKDPYLHSLAYDPADILPQDEFGVDSKDFEAIKEHVNTK